jgi:WhiB family redox-sensing transcriptional regulator
MTFPPATRRYPGQAAGRAERAGPARFTDEQLAGRVMSPLARCSGAATDPDEWFPAAAVVTAARSEAERALALCAACPVRAECLELSMRQWRTIGKYGIWGGLVEAERAAARGDWLAGAEITALLVVPGGDDGSAGLEDDGWAGPEDPGTAEPVRVTGLGGSRRTPSRPAGRSRRASGRAGSPRAAGARRRPLVEQYNSRRPVGD